MAGNAAWPEAVVGEVTLLELQPEVRLSLCANAALLCRLERENEHTINIDCCTMRVSDDGRVIAICAVECRMDDVKGKTRKKLGRAEL